MILIAHPFRINSPYKFEQNLSAEVIDGEITGFSGLASFVGATSADISRAIEFLGKVLLAIDDKCWNGEALTAYHRAWAKANDYVQLAEDQNLTDVPLKYYPNRHIWFEAQAELKDKASWRKVIL